jgi:membrane protease YdiL (CAAX protease family)
MNKSFFQLDEFFKSACYFEASLILVAVLLGWMATLDPFGLIIFSEPAFVYGVAGTIPLFFIFLVMEKVQGSSVGNIKRLLLNSLGPVLHRYHWADLFVLAAITGFSEELVFRGVIQPWMEDSWGKTVALIGSNVIFGLVHSLTPLYAVLAALVGIYLGLSLDYGGERNLLIPIIIHGLYDFLAFLVLMHVYRTNLLKHA